MEISEKSKKAIDEKWLEGFHREYNPVTKYVYENELERKQARFFESIVANVEAKDRHEMEADYKAAENAWKRQTRQAMIDTEDRAAVTAYRDAGVEEVMWISVCDNRTCEECSALNGLIFPVDRVPDKPHYNCRCHLEPVRKEKRPDTSTEIDELTPCLRKNSTGELVKTKVSRISPTRSKFSKWLFDWTQPEKNGYTVYALRADGDSRIQGLIALKKEQGYIDVDIVEAAPQNNSQNTVYFSGEKEYNGVGGHLFAEACRQSFEAGYDGYVGFTAKTNLVEYYSKELGAKPLFAGSQRMEIATDAARMLVDRYY